MYYSTLEFFEWDEDKAKTNFSKHGVSFFEAATIWRDDYSLETLNYPHSVGEERWQRLGKSINGHIFFVVFCESGNELKIRIISARKANKREREGYFMRLP